MLIFSMRRVALFFIFLNYVSHSTYIYTPDKCFSSIENKEEKHLSKILPVSSLKESRNRKYQGAGGEFGGYMKKIIALLAVLVLLFAFFGGCAANSTTGAITVINSTSTNCSSVKIGDVNFGAVNAGQSVTMYFYTAKNDASVSAEGFPFLTGVKGVINLKLNYVYEFALRNNTTNGKYFNGTGTSLSNGDETEALR